MSEADIAIRRGLPGRPAQSSAVVAGGRDASADVSAAAGAGFASAGGITERLRWLCSFPAMLGALLVGATFAVVRSFSVDPDLWWHIRTGELINDRTAANVAPTSSA